MPINYPQLYPQDGGMIIKENSSQKDYMKLNRFCTHCSKRCEKQVYWRPVNGIEYPYCSVAHWFEHRKGVEHAKAEVANQKVSEEAAQLRLFA